MGKLPLIAPKLVTRDLGLLHNVKKTDQVVKFTRVGQTRLLGFLATSHFECERELYLRNRKTK